MNGVLFITFMLILGLATVWFDMRAEVRHNRRHAVIADVLGGIWVVLLFYGVLALFVL